MKLFLSNRHRNEGTRILSGRGTGKSILNAQIAMQDWYENNLATAVWDTGHTIDNILLSIAEMPDATIRKALWKRVRYVNMGGMDGRVIPWPIFHRFTNEPKNEPDADVYERFIAAIQRVNPELNSASRQGMNAVKRVGNAVGAILMQRGLQLDAAEAIMADKFFSEKRDMDAFKEKVQDITRHPVTKAIYTTTPPGIDWQQVDDEKLLVLIDLRDIRRDTRRFAMVWTFWNLFDFIEYYRKPTMIPMSVIVDELSVLMKTGTFESEKQAKEDLDGLLNHTMRHTNTWLTIAHQQAVQFPGILGVFLAGMANQIIC